jgi:hypothetical protein
MKRIYIAACCLGLCWGSAKAGDAAVIAKAQFPVPQSAETEKEWNCYWPAYYMRYHAFDAPRSVVSPLLTQDPEAKEPPLAQPSPVFVPAPRAAEPACPDYSDLDASGRPIWFDGLAAGQLSNLVQMLFAQEKFADLDRLIDDWTTKQERIADGRWKLTFLLDGFKNESYQPNGWERMGAIIQRWKAANPTSAGAAIAEANYHYSLAWKARGGGYAASVEPEGWRLFEERLRKVERILSDSKSYASRNPLWGTLYLDVAALLNWPREKQYELYRAVTREHKYYYWAYNAYITFLAPKWGGDWSLVDAVIKDAEEKTRDVDGASTYTRMYWLVSGFEEVGFNIFKDTRADWPHMKQGFKDMLRLYPHSAWNANAYAVFACLARDGDSFWEARARMGDKITEQAWPSNLSIDVCEARFPGHAL